MRKPSILILPFHGVGHFNGLFGVARALAQTHDVIFAGNSYFLNLVSLRGFSYRTLHSQPFGLGLETWIHEKDTSTEGNVRDRQNDTLYHRRAEELGSMINEYKPIHILVDTQQATDLIVIKTIDPAIRVSLVSVAPPYLLIPGLPPINSLALPGDSEKAYEQSLGALNARVQKQRSKYNGLDDRSIVRRRLKENKLEHLEDQYPSLIPFAAKDVDQFILTYREFDFYHPHLDRFHYVGPHIDPVYVEPKAEDFHLRLGEAKHLGKSIIYVSFGTVLTEKDISSFLKRLEEAVEGLDYLVVVGSRENWVPQSTVLTYADVFITHGGINSVHDAIRHKVPMIVYPIDPNYDQNGNSSRVVYHKLGLRGDVDKDTPGDIRGKILEVTGFRKNFDFIDPSRYSIDNFIKMIL